jgi:hypothetical protein
VKAWSCGEETAHSLANKGLFESILLQRRILERMPDEERSY